jgi:hypothetical protein
VRRQQRCVGGRGLQVARERRWCEAQSGQSARCDPKSRQKLTHTSLASGERHSLQWGLQPIIFKPSTIHSSYFNQRCIIKTQSPPPHSAAKDAGKILPHTKARVQGCLCKITASYALLIAY